MLSIICNSKHDYQINIRLC